MTHCVRISASLLVLVLCGSCHKTLGPCTGNCQILHFTGIAVDAGNQKPLANLSVKVYVHGQTNCLICGPITVVSGTTKADGTFDLTATIDTSTVPLQFCSVSVQAPANYIVYAGPLALGGVSDPAFNNLDMALSIDSAGTSYEEFDFFQAILLTLRLHRTAAILPSEPFLSLSFTLSASSTSILELNETPSNADTVLTLNTGANVFTRINYGEFLTDSTKESLTDSIRCVPGANNSIEISYP
jgi:hypothetical protein